MSAVQKGHIRRVPIFAGFSIESRPSAPHNCCATCSPRTAASAFDQAEASVFKISVIRLKIVIGVSGYSSVDLFRLRECAVISQTDEDHTLMNGTSEASSTCILGEVNAGELDDVESRGKGDDTAV